MARRDRNDGDKGMNELIAFITARLDEDVQAADTSLRFVAEAKRIEAMDRRRTRNPVSQWTLDMEARAKRTLAEVAAKRAILTMWQPDPIDELAVSIGDWTGCSDSCIGTIGSHILRTIAAIYHDHPDWREEWAA